MASIEADTLEGAGGLRTVIVTGGSSRSAPMAAERSGVRDGPLSPLSARRGALEHPRPRPNYVVTTPARVGVALKRMPPATFRRFLASRA